MARGETKAATDQLAKTNAIGDANQAQADTLEKQLIPGYTSLMDTGYLSPEDRNAAVTSEMGSATQPFESMGFKANNRAAATNNASDLTGQEDQLALDEGRTAGTAAAELDTEKMNNQLQGMYGLGGQEAGNRAEATSMYGLGPATLSAGRTTNPWLDILGKGLGAGGAIGGAILGS